MKKVALIYDFDKTLCDRDMQEYSLIPELGYDKPGLFWGEVDQIASSQHMDHIGAYLYLLMRKFCHVRVSPRVIFNVAAHFKRTFNHRNILFVDFFANQKE